MSIILIIIVKKGLTKNNTYINIMLVTLGNGNRKRRQKMKIITNRMKSKKVLHLLSLSSWLLFSQSLRGSGTELYWNVRKSADSKRRCCGIRVGQCNQYSEHVHAGDSTIAAIPAGVLNATNADLIIDDLDVDLSDISTPATYVYPRITVGADGIARITSRANLH
jgi:hypothetical protein